MKADPACPRCAMLRAEVRTWRGMYMALASAITQAGREAKPLSDVVLPTKPPMLAPDDKDQGELL